MGIFTSREGRMAEEKGEWSWGKYEKMKSSTWVRLLLVYNSPEKESIHMDVSFVYAEEFKWEFYYYFLPSGKDKNKDSTRKHQISEWSSILSCV